MMLTMMTVMRLQAQKFSDDDNDGDGDDDDGDDIAGNDDDDDNDDNGDDVSGAKAFWESAQRARSLQITFTSIPKVHHYHHLC